VPGLPRDSVEIGEELFDQRQPTLRLARQLGAACDGARVTIDADHLRIRGREDGAAVTTGAEGRVDVEAAVTHIEEINGGAAEHGNVEG
jgi:hypothetical protein